ncbi:MAG: TolC family protein [Longimicrobiales bacterium]
MKCVVGSTGVFALALTALAATPAESQDTPAPSSAVRDREQEPTVTMDEAVEMALVVSPTMAVSEGTVSTSEWGERAAWAEFLPSLSLSTGASRSSSQRFDPNTNRVVTGAASENYNAGLTASIDLFTAGRRGAQLRESRAITAAAEAVVVEQRFAVTVVAKSAFFQVLRADELIGVAETQLEQARTGFEAAVQRLTVGSATRSDSLRARLEVNQAEQALLEATTQRRAAAYALGALTGTAGPVGARLDVPLDVRPITYNEGELVEMALGSAPAMRSAEANVTAAGAALGASRTQYFPTIGATGRYSFSNTQPAFENATRSWNVGLSLSYPIFNRFAREDSKARAAVDLNVAEAELDNRRLEIRANVVRALDQAGLSEQRLGLSEEALEVAREDMRVQEERYGLGASTILELITSQIALAQAEQGLVNARYDYQIARAELEALVGREL